MTGLLDCRLQRLFAYWMAKRGDRPAPQRADVDPLEIPDLLPILNLIDVLHDPLRFRHRLVGTAVVEAMGRDVTGRFVGEDLYGPAAPEIVDSLARVVAEGRPFRRYSRLSWKGKNWQILEALELPLVESAGQVEMILRGSAFTRGGTEPPVRLIYEPIELPED